MEKLYLDYQNGGGRKFFLSPKETDSARGLSSLNLGFVAHSYDAGHHRSELLSVARATRNTLKDKASRLEHGH
ncbi:hypothetical protein [Mycobacterium sp. HUMS_1102779]|uniref:hypothetical protein n=1 Tax=Mycobacterium sp. HUMS_1102779 TaxID=3383487 RepID=UPI00389A05CF